MKHGGQGSRRTLVDASISAGAWHGCCFLTNYTEQPIFPLEETRHRRYPVAHPRAQPIHTPTLSQSTALFPAYGLSSQCSLLLLRLRREIVSTLPSHACLERAGCGSLGNCYGCSAVPGSHLVGFLCSVCLLCKPTAQAQAGFPSHHRVIVEQNMP
ncbi:hypothetical protein BDW60DRAFT_185500 [Aspergillus nidulans var. acristatus]